MTSGVKPPSWGEPVPWFRARALSGNPAYAFDTAAGRPMLLLFFGSAAQAACAAALAQVSANRALFDDVRGCFFGVTIDPSDERRGRIVQQIPGLRFFLDYDRAVSRMFGASDGDAYTPFWLVVDR